MGVMERVEAPMSITRAEGLPAEKLGMLALFHACL